MRASLHPAMPSRTVPAVPCHRRTTLLLWYVKWVIAPHHTITAALGKTERNVRCGADISRPSCNQVSRTSLWCTKHFILFSPAASVSTAMCTYARRLAMMDPASRAPCLSRNAATAANTPARLSVERAQSTFRKVSFSKYTKCGLDVTRPHRGIQALLVQHAVWAHAVVRQLCLQPQMSRRHVRVLPCRSKRRQGEGRMHVLFHISQTDHCQTCPCGSTPVALLLDQPRSTCTDPIPVCDGICNKVLGCLGGESHRFVCSHASSES